MTFIKEYTCSDQTAVLPVAGRATRSCRVALLLLAAILLVTLIVPATCGAQDTTAKAKRKPELPFKPGTNWVRLTVDHEVWIDLKRKQVLVGGRVCLREGMLEMFSCPQGTKEHEAVVAANTPARFVHAGLVALGAKPGPAVQFQPEYKPARGTEIEIVVIWKDLQGKEHRVRAQEWVKQTKTGEALQSPWVFAGSGFWTDEDAGERFYYADGGEFICVSNFSTAMLDLPVASSDANDTLMFCAFTERIPPRETRVYLLLTPKFKPTDEGKKTAADKKPGENPPEGKKEAKKSATDKAAGKGPAQKTTESKEEAKKSTTEKEPDRTPPAEKVKGPGG